MKKILAQRESITKVRVAGSIPAYFFCFFRMQNTPLYEEEIQKTMEEIFMKKIYKLVGRMENEEKEELEVLNALDDVLTKLRTIRRENKGDFNRIELQDMLEVEGILRSWSDANIDLIRNFDKISKVCDLLTKY